MLRLNTIGAPKGANRKNKRIGRGQGSGQGTQAGKGHKGQKARKSGGVRPGFEGGNLRLYMKLPKWGVFTNARFKTEYAILNLSKLDVHFQEGEEISKETLLSKGLLSGAKKHLALKVLAKDSDEFGKNLVFKGIKKFSVNAKQLIEKAGGSIS